MVEPRDHAKAIKVQEQAVHPSSFENMRRCLDWYGPSGRSFQVADLGSAGVNGTYRELFDERAKYVGLDLEPGPNVDIVQEDPYRLPLGDASIDLVISGQMLEHCAHFWRVFTEIERVLADNGLAFIIAPSAGPIHRYPVDCYRFFPDAFAAAADWSGLRLVDCWHDERGPWRDLVGVFQKGGTARKISGPISAGDAMPAFEEDPDPSVNVVAGRRPYLEVLKALHDIVQPGIYVEIGVRKGVSLSLCKGPAIAVDPFPHLSGEHPDVRIYAETSDDFFFFHAKDAITAPVDLAFIDGMHRCEFVYRDFMNIERFMSPNGIVVIDDILPNRPIQAARERQSRVWTGDVWKFAELLQTVRPDLKLTFFDTSPSGLLVISGLNPANTVLWDNYNPWVRQLLARPDLPVPERFLHREGAVEPSDEAIARAVERG